MNKEEMIEKMKNIREQVELKYLKEELENENQKQKATKRVKNVKYIGEIDIENATQSVFLVDEQEVDEYGDLINEYSNCYTEDGTLLGRYIEYLDSIILMERFKDLDNIYNQIDKLDLNGILDLEQIEKTQLEEIANALGIDKEEIKSLSSMELAQKIEEKQDTNGKQNDDKLEEDEPKEEKLNKEETKKITDGKQEIKLDTRVDEYKTLGKVLDLNESEYSKVAIVYSEKLKEIQGENNSVNNTMYSFVAIKKDGTSELINDRLKVDERSGNDSLKESIKIDADEKARKDNKTKTRFQIIGKNGQNEGKSDYEKETLSVEQGQYGEIKAFYGKGRTKDNVNIETQLETSNIKPTSIEIKRMQAERKGTYKENNEKMATEADYYFDKGAEEVSMYSVDGDENTVILSDYIDNNKDEIVAKIMQNETIANSQFGESDIKEKLQGVIEKENQKPYTQEEIEQIINDIETEIANDAGNFPTRNRY